MTVPVTPDASDLDGLRARLAADGQRRRPLGLGRVRISPDALDHLADDIDAVRTTGDVVLLMDATPMTIAGRDLKARVVRELEARFGATALVLQADGPELHADAHALAQADEVVAGAGCVVALGSGTVTDIAKDASFRAGCPPFVVIQTAVSVNAFSDDMAVLLRDGVKRTVPSRWPDVLIVDLRVIADAPSAMNQAGFGELCSMFTAPADWYLSKAIGMDASFDPQVVALFRDGAEGLLVGADRVRRQEPSMLAELAGRMTLTGIAMGVAGRTAPLSGTEHLLSHLLDMSATANDRPLAFHGAQVGVAAVLAAAMWQDTLDRFDPSTVADGGPPIDAGALEQRVHAAFAPLDPSGRMGAECWRDVQAKVERWTAGRPAVAAFAAEWPRHRDALRSILVPPETIADALRAAGAAATIDALDPPARPDAVAWALRSLPLMRDRFTVADLRLFSDGWPTDEADRILDRSGILGSAGVGR